ncbi:rhomboid family intramembrane serine protease [Caldinitratiruptor microaerophilus]|uniref:Rhomboid family intramembrane serine protease n=1 Tax=Caldinitratiruptor microaerophilus TaxID=671077 RepID=A0AA35CLV1_9FIRM|nr:rhomboid family intramembrane serine protease [Caldinitratiruptor microaerophilus]BDG59665.1 rhomboid family intramembrane serine protease [Caldinitratiruptor microaerophilus]
MLPLRDSVRTRRRAWMNWLLVAVTTAVFLVQDSGAVERADLFRTLAVIPVRIFDLGLLAGLGYWPLLTLLTATFLHGGWIHLLGNMLYLWVFGDNVEDRLGHLRYLAFYLAGGFVANLAHVLANPFSSIPTIGASGAVAAVLGAYAVTFPQARVLALVPVGAIVPVLRVPAWALLGLWFLLQLWGGIAGPGAQPVAWWAHIGGFLAGMGLVRLLAPAREPQRVG